MHGIEAVRGAWLSDRSDRSDNIPRLLLQEVHANPCRVYADGGDRGDRMARLYRMVQRGCEESELRCMIRYKRVVKEEGRDVDE